VPTTRIYDGVGDLTPRGQSQPSSPLGFPRRRPLNADDQPPLVAADANRHVLLLTRRSHPRKPSCREAPARPIGALREGAGTGLPSILLGWEISRRRLGRTGASLKPRRLLNRYRDRYERHRWRCYKRQQRHLRWKERVETSLLPTTVNGSTVPKI
jgi:hypothetical protein